MSQERTRFPIQPEDRRRSARSSRDVKAVPEERAQPDKAPQDKPQVPPHRRGERQRAREQDQPDDAAGGDD